MLELEDVSHVYANGTRALDRVTLSIPRGLYGLLGPNGAGKSTLMRAIATLQTPTEGSIRFGGIDVIAEPEKLRRELGYLPQDFGVYPRVSAYEMLDHMAVLKGVASPADRKATVETLLQQTNLWSVRRKMLSGFSGGMRQRFGIAQALIGNPELIIVDEPTAGLDPEERNRFLNLLAEIGENVVVILSTHIVDDVSDLCARMAVLAEGRGQLEGAPRELIHSRRGRIRRQTARRAGPRRAQGRAGGGAGAAGRGAAGAHSFDARPDLAEDRRPARAGARARGVRAALDASRRRAHRGAHPLRPRSGQRLHRRRCRAGRRLLLHARAGAARGLRRNHAPADRALRISLSPAQPARVADGRRDVRVAGHRHERVRLRARLRRRPARECRVRHAAQLPRALRLLHVRDDVVRRERGDPRRRNRLRAHHPFHAHHEVRIPLRPLPRRRRAGGALHAARAVGDRDRDAGAVGRSGVHRPAPAHRSPLRVLSDRAAESLHPLRDLLRAR